jgi:hypothetical protein
MAHDDFATNGQAQTRSFDLILASHTPTIEPLANMLDLVFR